ncbi:TetR/AcrR family transcriptional regulator C-terminal domain-containing protein [Kitasatospora albolonga]|uniref:TetR/AcrR family transcriptional regulator n=1 Tax=Kitasatospora albolonga TaxID=68173 RepID=UPI0031EDA7C9
MAEGIDPERLWLPPDRPGRGRPPRYSREQITVAAVGLADEEGLAAVTMRAVAARLGVAVMSLYSYVPDKDTLLELMVDAVSAGMEFPPPSEDWRADVRGLARAQRTLMHRHPWLVAALPQRRTIGPGTLAALEHALAVLAPSGLSGGARAEVFALISGFVASHVGYELAQRRALETAGPDFAAAQYRYLTTMAATGAYPHLAATLAEPPTPADPDATFTRLLDRLLAGVTD